MGTILCIGTLDTKGAEVRYVKELIEGRGHTALIMDISSLGKPSFKPDITAEEIARAAGSTMQEVRAFEEVGPAVEVMSSGAITIIKELHRSGRLQGVISIGGGTGSAVASAAMRELPIGFPKFLLSTQKIVQAGIMGYVGSKDIAVMPSIVDISGLNRLTRQALSNAVGAIVGMVESPEPESEEKPLVFMTMLGATSSCGLKVRSFLEDAGFEVVVFHTIGVGGQTFEEAVKTYPVKGVVELSLNEIGNELFGGLASAGPNRLEAAGKKGIPQVITVSAIGFINFLGPDTVPDRYKDRKTHFHNPQSTAPRLNAEELKLIGETVAKKLNLAIGPVKVLVPLRGSCSLEYEGSTFHNPVADQAFLTSLKSSLKGTIEVKEMDAHISSDKFARTVADEFLDMLGSSA